MTLPHLTGAPLAGLPTQEAPVPGQFLRHVQDQMPNGTRAPPCLRCQFLPLFSTPSFPIGHLSIDTMRGRLPLRADNSRIHAECATLLPGRLRRYPQNHYNLRSPPPGGQGQHSPKPL